MPKKIEFKKIGDTYHYEVTPLVKEEYYFSVLRLPAELGRLLKGKKVKVIIEPVNKIQ